METPISIIEITNQENGWAIITMIATLLSAIATACAAYFAYWSAKKTAKMAQIMQSEFETSSRPYLMIDTEISKKGLEQGKIAVRSENIGKIPIVAQTILFSVNNDAGPLRDGVAKEILIFPQKEGYLIKEFNKNLEPITTGIFEIDISINYWALGNKKKSYLTSKKIKMNLDRKSIEVLKDEAT